MFLTFGSETGKRFHNVYLSKANMGCILIELWSWKQDQKKKDWLIHESTGMIWAKASVIPALKAQINVPSVVELKGLNAEILGINDRHNAVNETVQYSMSSKRN